MNEHSTPKAGPDAFDGDAISRADRDFLASLGDHPLLKHPLFDAPLPPRPNYDGCCSLDDRTEAQEKCFGPALDWMLVNYAYYSGAFMGKGGIISLVDGKMVTTTSMRGLMQPFTIVREGPKKGLVKTTVVDVWMTHSLRTQVDGIQCRSDKSRPTFTEGNALIVNRYRPPTHPADGGEIETFERFFARLVPDAAEREWFWHFLAHKARRPWVPMVAVIMVAEKFGTGRGTLFNILELTFGEDYVVPCDFGELTGRSARARFNDRLAAALLVTINEADDEDGHLQTRRRLSYEVLKNFLDPSPTARQNFEKKGHDVYTQRAARTAIFATQHRDLVKLPHDDRRIEVITSGRAMTREERDEIRAWMATRENIGALHRALLARPAVPLEEFDPFGVPPPFAGRLTMIGMGKTRLEDAYEVAIGALKDYPLFTMTQALRLIGYFGSYTTGDWANMARHAVSKNAYRLRKKGETGNRIRYRKHDEIVYAGTADDQQRWQASDTKLIIRQLDMTEKMTIQLINTDMAEYAEALEKIRREHEQEKPATPDEDEKDD